MLPTPLGLGEPVGNSTLFIILLQGWVVNHFLGKSPSNASGQQSSQILPDPFGPLCFSSLNSL